MEMFAAVMGLFVVGLLAYAAAQLRVGLRDLSHAFALRMAARRGGAAVGPVLLRGRVRGDRLLSPPAGGEQVIAWSARRAYSFGDEAEAAPFVLHGLGDGEAQVVHVDAARLVLLAEERTDTFSNRVRALAHDAEVLVYGVLVQRAGRAVLCDVPGRGVVVADGKSPVIANLARAALAMVAVVTFGVVAVVAHMP
jgi:hypothetical protein